MRQILMQSENPSIAFGLYPENTITLLNFVKMPRFDSLQENSKERFVFVTTTESTDSGYSSSVARTKAPNSKYTSWNHQILLQLCCQMVTKAFMTCGISISFQCSRKQCVLCCREVQQWSFCFLFLLKELCYIWSQEYRYYLSLVF